MADEPPQRPWTAPGGSPDGAPGAGRPPADGTGSSYAGPPPTAPPLTYGPPAYGAPPPGAPVPPVAYGPGAPLYGPGAPRYGPGPAYGQPPSAQLPSGPPGVFRPPEPKPGVVPLRPLGLGEILDGAFQTIRRYPRVTLGLSAAVAIVQGVLTLITTLSTRHSVTTFPQPGSNADPAAVFGQAFASTSTQLTVRLVGSAVSSVLTAVLTGILILIVAEAVLGRPVDLRAVLDRIRPRFWSLLGTALIAGLLPWLGPVIGALVGLAVGAAVGLTAGLVTGFLLGFALLVFPGVWLWTVLSLSAPTVVLEKLRPVPALRRSAALVKGDFWRVLGIRLLSLVIGGILAAIIAVPFELVGVIISAAGGGLDSFTSGTPAIVLVLTSIGAVIANTIVAPFLSGVLAILYLDRRMRAEGLDIVLQQAARNGVTEPGLTATPRPAGAY